jgi:23S rRNA pseudouridine2605 synthase
MSLDGELLSPALVRALPGNDAGTSLISITIREGKNRQVRRMCEAAKLQVLRLRRVREGKLLLGDLESGRWRFLTPEEITYLKSL